MKRCVLWVLVLLGLSACSPHDEHYYAVHPKALEKAMLQCPQRAVGALSCEQLKTIAERLNQLAYLLRLDQQTYGKKIIALQEARDLNRLKMQKNPNQPALKQALDNINQQLEEHLAVVKWLGSPV